MSQELGDVAVHVHEKWGFCSSCHVEVAAGEDNSYHHFDITYRMCHAPINDQGIVAKPLMKRAYQEPTDFEWGPLNQAGAYNLALAILWDVLGQTPSRQLTKSFAVNVVSSLPKNEWSMSEHRVKEWMAISDGRYTLEPA